MSDPQTNECDLCSKCEDFSDDSEHSVHPDNDTNQIGHIKGDFGSHRRAFHAHKRHQDAERQLQNAGMYNKEGSTRTKIEVLEEGSSTAR